MTTRRYWAAIVPQGSKVLLPFHCKPMRARKSPELAYVGLNAGVGS